jgi:pyroglutamyl-peptidase
MKILVTGFDPFGKESVNPSYEAVKRIKNNNEDIELFIKEIPVVFGKAIDVLEDAMNDIEPDAVICIGQAGGRSDITIERVGINIDDARITDNDGNQPIDEVIYEDGENAYFSNLPIKTIVEKLREINIPASVSNTAGTYVCNNLLYGVMYLIDKKYPGVRGGFVHVPFLPEQVLDKANTPSMPLDLITKALESIVHTVAVTEMDIKVTAGKIC